MRTRLVLSVLLLVVAGAAAVLSFAALRDLARSCGFTPGLAWLLPVVVDAGAAAGSLVWLGDTTTSTAGGGSTARRFARALALGLLGLSVAANALGHGLAAFSLAPPWWVVVIVSAVAPAVLGAVVHLAVLVGRPAPIPGAASAAGAVRVRSGSDEPGAADRDRPGPHGPGVAELIAAGAGRRRLARELDITEHEARRLLDHARRTNTDLDAGVATDEHRAAGQDIERDSGQIEGRDLLSVTGDGGAR